MEIVVADALNAESLRKALEGIHAAYYLIHSLLCGPEEFEAKEIQAAENFRNAAKAEGVARIIYLGALGDVRASLSPHLRSRMQVAEELGAGPSQRPPFARRSSSAPAAPRMRSLSIW